MKLKEIIRKPVAVMIFNKEDIDTLLSCCNSHNDPVIKSIAEKGGFIYLWKVLLEFFHDKELDVHVDDDILDKVIRIFNQDFTEESEKISKLYEQLSSLARHFMGISNYED